MKMKNLTVITAILFSIVMWSCNGGSKSLSGEYVCTKHYSESMIGEVKLDFNEDGTCISVTEFANIKGTYEVKGDSVYITNNLFELTLKLEGNKVYNSSVEYTKE